MQNSYDTDFYLWIEQTVEAMKSRDTERIDWANLIEELEGMGRSETRAIYSYLKQLILHLLKLKYWSAEQERNRRHWKKEVVNFRSEIKNRLEESPSLKNKLPDIYQRANRDACRAASELFDLPDNLEAISLEIILKDDYFG